MQFRHGFVLRSIVLFIVLFGLCAPLSLAQEPLDSPWVYPNCNWQCTAGDVSIDEVYLADVNGDDLPACNSGDPVSAWIWATFTNSAEASRYGVVTFADLYVNDVKVDSLEKCDPEELEGKETLSASLAQVSFTCGAKVELKNVLVVYLVNEPDEGASACPPSEDCSDYEPSKCHKAESIVLQDASPTPTPDTPTATPVPPTDTPTATSTSTPTATSTSTPTATSTSTATATSTFTPSATSTSAPTATSTSVPPTESPTTESPTATPEPTSVATETPTTESPTATPEPTKKKTTVDSPSESTPVPTAVPTPTEAPVLPPEVPSAGSDGGALPALAYTPGFGAALGLIGWALKKRFLR